MVSTETKWGTAAASASDRRLLWSLRLGAVTVAALRWPRMNISVWFDLVSFMLLGLGFQVPGLLSKFRILWDDYQKSGSNLSSLT